MKQALRIKYPAKPDQPSSRDSLFLTLRACFPEEVSSHIIVDLISRISIEFENKPIEDIELKSMINEYLAAELSESVKNDIIKHLVIYYFREFS